MRTIAAALLAFAAFGNTPAIGQIELKSRTIAPSTSTTPEFLQALKAAPGKAMHGLASFSRIPTDAERKALEAAGIRLLAPFSHFTYRVRVDKRLDLRRLKLADLKMDLINLGPEDRVEPRLWQEDFAKYTITPPKGKPHNYVLNADGTLTLSVRIHPGVDNAETARALKRHAQKFQREGDRAWVIVVPRTSLRALTAEDIVQWIDAGPLPFLPENDLLRAAINVDTVQNFNVSTGQVQGLGGKGVQVGVFDKGVDQGHKDFNVPGDDSHSRVVRDDAGLMEYHATHVAGIIAGDGRQSDKTDSLGRNNNGTPYQWRGVAPLAEVLDIDQMPPFGQNGKNPDTHMEYISHSGMDLSNHSYVFSVDGVYDSSNHARDEIIRGDAMSGGNRVPPRLHVTSAGNNGQSPCNPTCYGNQVGYFALTKELKNALVVGNWNVVTNQIEPTSSLGPAHDGRIKPDVVAPGKTIASTAEAPNGGVNSTGFCANGEASAFCENPPPAGNYVQRRNFYRVARGTSMASAAATGVAALVLEQYVSTYGVDLDQKPPLPSTLRAVIIHTARDIQAASPWPSNPDAVTVQPGLGPDFVTGWGLIDAQAAVTLVASRRLREDTVPATCHVRTYLFNVPSGSSATRVTLAWDDVASDPGLSSTTPKLVNDLDLVLVPPDGNERYPWQLDQSITTTGGNVLSDAEQLCGTAIKVQRNFIPVTNPVYDPADSAHNVNDTGVAPAAMRGRDHLNNVEVVDETPQAGMWLAKVIGFKVPEGPQKFSLIGANFLPFDIHPTSLCRAYPKLCKTLAIPANLCIRFPKICETRISFPSRDRIRMQFVHDKQKLVLPLPPPTLPSSAYDIEIRSRIAPLNAAVYSSRGQLMKTAARNSASQRLRFATQRGERYFLVVSPGSGAQLNTDYYLDMKL